MQITRKQFLGRLIGSAAGIAGAAMIMGCGSSNSGGGGGGGDIDASPAPGDAGSSSDAAHAASCLMNGTTYAIGANHGHVLMVSKQDVAAGVAKTYDITGTASHPHSVTVTAPMFATLKGNAPVSTTSSTNSGHSHPVMVMCA